VNVFVFWNVQVLQKTPRQFGRGLKQADTVRDVLRALFPHRMCKVLPVPCKHELIAGMGRIAFTDLYPEFQSAVHELEESIFKWLEPVKIGVGLRRPMTGFGRHASFLTSILACTAEHCWPYCSCLTSYVRVCVCACVCIFVVEYSVMVDQFVAAVNDGAALSFEAAWLSASRAACDRTLNNALQMYEREMKEAMARKVMCCV
jgi:hypothetical protein